MELCKGFQFPYGNNISFISKMYYEHADSLKLAASKRQKWSMREVLLGLLSLF